VYRVVQEALTNCARHAKASSVRITCHGSEHLVIVTVEDDGIGPLRRPPDPLDVPGR
jgi:signal transduction histidine kinase